VKVRPLEPPFVAEVAGSDARTAHGQSLEDALLRHPVLVFREQDLEPGDVVAVASRLGEPERYQRPHPDHPEHPEIAVFSNRSERGLVPRPYWHTDGLLRETPPRFTLFYAVEAPEQGGDTLFADARALYAQLDEEDRAALEGLECVLPTGTRHPLVKAHPVTGVPALYANLAATVGIVGVERSSAQRLFAQLSELYETERNAYRHHYRAGDLVIWDNEAVAHSATEPPPPEDRRLIWRADVRPGA
jgi:alpha-ketoglutarate-dependent taurine dioxygenase